jgi:pyrroline-5-carboxylate reductase
MRIAIIGCGVIGEAFAKALRKKATLFLRSKRDGRAAAVAKQVGGSVWKGEKVDWVVLAVKPHDIEAVAKEHRLKKGQQLVSCLAGVSLERLEQLFPGVRVARVMPNLLIQVKKGVLPLSGYAPEELIEWLELMGRVYVVDEAMLNKLTALTGSGPAFIFAVAEALMDGAIAIGIPASDAQQYIGHLFTGVGAAMEGDHPAQWRQRVCSPGGTTIAGIRKLEESGVRSGLIEALVAAYERISQVGGK